MPTETKVSTRIAGHGVAIATRTGRHDEDALTLAVDAVCAALDRAGRPDVARIVLAARRTVANDAAVLLAACRLADDVPVLRATDVLDSLDLIAGSAATTIVVEADDERAAAILCAPEGYAALGPIARAGGGAPIVEARRDPRLARVAGGRALAAKLGVSRAVPRALDGVIAVIEGDCAGRVALAAEGAVSAVDVVLDGEVPAGWTRAELEARAQRGDPTAAPPTIAAPRPRGATGVDPDGALLWRERRELLVPLGAACARCHHVNVPPSGAVLCRRCGARDLELVEVGRTGTTLTFARSTVLPQALGTDLTMIYADLDDGVRWKALGTGADLDQLVIGDRLELVLRRLGLDDGTPIYGLAFRRMGS